MTKNNLLRQTCSVTLDINSLIWDRPVRRHLKSGIKYPYATQISVFGGSPNL